MTRPTLVLVLALLAAPLAADPPPDPPAPSALCVLPFFTPQDPDYGVLLSDRVVTGLYHRRDIAALDRRRFELYEPDGLTGEATEGIFDTLPELQTEDLQALRDACPADFAVLGRQVEVSRTGSAGVNTLELYLVDLQTGSVLWSDRIKHDIRYIWASKRWRGGEVFVEDTVARLGFVDHDLRLPEFERGEVPRKISLMPFFNVGNPLLVKAAERFVHRRLIEDDIFTVVHKGEQRLARAGRDLREAAKAKQAEAVFIGSMMDAGMEEAIEENVTTAARLVDVETGRIVWSASASDRRVWRAETPDAMAESVATQLVRDFFDTIQRTEDRRMERIRRRVGIRVVR